MGAAGAAMGATGWPPARARGRADPWGQRGWPLARARADPWRRGAVGALIARSHMSRRENDLSPDSIEGFEPEKGEGHFKQFMCQK
jgi:hypothetical protein